MYKGSGVMSDLFLLFHYFFAQPLPGAEKQKQKTQHAVPAQTFPSDALMTNLWLRPSAQKSGTAWRRISNTRVRHQAVLQSLQESNVGGFQRCGVARWSFVSIPGHCTWCSRGDFFLHECRVRVRRPERWSAGRTDRVQQLATMSWNAHVQVSAC